MAIMDQQPLDAKSDAKNGVTFLAINIPDLPDKKGSSQAPLSSRLVKQSIEAGKTKIQLLLLTMRCTTGRSLG